MKGSAAALTSLALASSTLLVPSPAWAKAAAKPYDFDGDGKPDLVVGAPGLNRASIQAAGGIVIMPGSGGQSKIITQSTKKVAGGSELDDHFGSALASADFDRDGYADLAVGIPGEDFKGKRDAGAVTVLYGSSKGLTGQRSRQISEPTGKSAHAGFGSALAAGDLNGDGYPDLAVGAPDEHNDDYTQRSTVTVLLGGPRGVRTSGRRLLLGVRGTPESDDRFGSSLAVADVDGRHGLDLVVMSSGSQGDDDYDGEPGSVSYCSGGTGGLKECRRLIYSLSIQNNNTVVVGNVEGDQRPEIVVGAPAEVADEYADTVAVLTLTGSGAGTSAQPAGFFTPPDLGLTRPPGDDEGNGFGSSLALGRVNGDAYDDLVIGAPGGLGGVDGGRVAVVHGGATGLARSGNVEYDQDTPGVPGGSEDGDGFGQAVTLLDRNGDGECDLVIGAPGDDHIGRVTTLLARGGGFTTQGAKALDLRDLAPHYDNRSDARFGAVLGQ